MHKHIQRVKPTQFVGNLRKEMVIKKGTYLHKHSEYTVL